MSKAEASNGTNNAPQVRKKKFRPYKGATLDTPFVHFLLEPILPVIRPTLGAIFAVRWQLSRPLQIRVFPSWFPFVDISLIRELPFLTIGQVLLSLPLLIIFLSGYYFTFVTPDVERSGDFAAYAIYATFLTANKTNSLASFLFGISFERMLPFHNLAALTTVALSCFHCYVAFAYEEGGAGSGSGDRRLSSEDSPYGMLGPDTNFVKYLFDGSNNVSGTLLALSMFVLVLSSVFPIFRRSFFDVWLWTHILCTLCVIVFATLHEVTSILLIAAWWGVDLMMRYLLMAGCRYPKRAALELVSSDVVKISFEKPRGFSYNAGQFVQIAVPEIDSLAFHPITISSAPYESRVTIHVRSLGNWSKKLLKLAEEKDEISILLEGPFGCVSVDIDDDSRYKMALLVSGGIGVTHCQSVAKSILHDHKNGRKLKHLRFVWALRDLEMLKVMDPLIEPTTGGDVEVGDTSEFQTEMMRMPSSSAFASAQQLKPQDRMVETDIFLTKSSAGAPDTTSDGRNIYYGRPDLEAIVSDMKEQALRLRVSHVAVFACGPKVLVDTLKEVCRHQSQTVVEMRGVTFDVHEEIFDF